MAEDKKPAEKASSTQPAQDAVERAYEAKEKAKSGDEATKKPRASAKPTAADKPADKPAEKTAPKAKETPAAKPADPKPAEAKPDASKPADAKPAAPAKPGPEPEPKPQMPQPEAQDTRKGGGKFAWTLVFLLLFFIGGVAATPYLLPQVKPFLPEQAKAYFARLESAPGVGISASSGLSADVAEMTAKLNQLDAGLKDVRQVASDARTAAQSAAEEAATAPTSAVDEGALTDLSTRLDALAGQLEQVAKAQSDQADSYARLQENLSALPTEGESGISPAVIATLRGQLEDLAGAQSGLSQTLDSLEDQVTGLADTVNTPADDVASASALGDVADALRARLASLEERIDVVSQAATSAADPEALAGVEASVSTQMEDFSARLEALENVRQQATAAMVAGLETARLAQAVSNGRAYGAELKALRQLKAQAGPALPDIADLLDDIAPFADSGIPSGAALAAQLEDRSREILTALDTPEDANWWQRLLARMRNLVTVRQVGAAADGDSASSVLARAEGFARDGDWQAVVSAIDAMPSAAQSSLGPWWQQAQARAQAQQVLADLGARLGVSVLGEEAPMDSTL